MLKYEGDIDHKCYMDTRKQWTKDGQHLASNSNYSELEQ